MKKQIKLDQSKLLGFRICSPTTASRRHSKVGGKPARPAAKIGTVKIGAKTGLKPT